MKTGKKDFISIFILKEEGDSWGSEEGNEGREGEKEGEKQGEKEGGEREGEGGRGKERYFIYWFTLQMPTLSRYWPGQRQEPGTLSGSLLWIAWNQVFEPLLLLPGMLNSWKLGWKWNHPYKDHEDPIFDIHFLYESLQHWAFIGPLISDLVTVWISICFILHKLKTLRFFFRIIFKY